MEKKTKCAKKREKDKTQTLSQKKRERYKQYLNIKWLWPTNKNAMVWHQMFMFQSG